MSLLPYESTEGDNNRLRPLKNDPQIARPRSGFPLWGGALIILLIASVGFGYYYLTLRKPAPETELTVQKPDNVLMGEPFKITLNYANNSDQNLQNVRMAITLPEGVVLLGQSADKRFDEEDLGELAPHAYGKREFDLLAIEGPESIKHFAVKMRYGLGDTANHEYAISADTDVAIGPAAIDINLITPQSVSTGQSFNLVLNYRNASNIAFPNAVISFNYPRAFRLEDATSSPEVGAEDGTFPLGNFAPNSTGTIVLTGSVVGAAGSFSIPAKLTADFDGQTYEFWNAAPNIAIAQAPLSLDISANGDPNFVAHVGDTLDYSLHYKNNSPVSLQNVKISVGLTGALVDLSRLSVKGGSFSSVNNTVTWDAASSPQLSTVNAGEEGSVTFSIPLVRSFTPRRISDKNFTVKLSGTIESPTVPPGVAAQKTISYANLETKIAGDIAGTATAYYYEPTAGIKNSGPYPPRVNKTTQFTVHWQLRNGITDVANVALSTKLAPGVRFVSSPKSSVEQKPVYDAQSGIVSWNIPNISATQGSIGSPIEAIFQIEITPAVNQVGQTMQLIGDTNLKAKDSFTGLSIEKTMQSQNTGEVVQN